MKVVIRLSKSAEAKALPILLRHSPGVVLPDRTYVLAEEAVRSLREAGIAFSEASAPRSKKVPSRLNSESEIPGRKTS